MTLSDSQIDRYSRQIVLPEIGSRGQERLLASRVAIRGGGDAALVCASYLAGAGVGRLRIDDLGRIGVVSGILGFGGTEPAMLSAALAARNPDCHLEAESAELAAVLVSIGTPLPDESSSVGAVIWGAADEAAVLRVHFPRGTACAPCLRAASLLQSPAADDQAAPLLGTLLAMDALRVLLGLDRDTRPSLLRWQLSPAAASILPFPASADCARCRAH